MAWLTFATLLATFITLWLPSLSRFWLIPLAATLLCAWLGQIADPIAIGSTLAFAALVYGYRKIEYRHSLSSVVLWLIIIISGLAFALHQIPGFKPLLIDSASALRYNLDKALVGLLLLGGLCATQHKREDWAKLFFYFWPFWLGSCVLIFGLAYALHWQRFDVKLPSLLLWWALGNLFITCIAEELFFRRLIQQKLQLLLGKQQHAAILAITCTALLFGAAHLASGWKMAILASLAGLAYGAIYQRTRLIEASILLHFAVNLVHAVLFVYPGMI